MKLISSSIMPGFPVTLLAFHDIEILNEAYQEAKNYLKDKSIKKELIEKYSNKPKTLWKIWHIIEYVCHIPLEYKEPRQSEEAIKAIEQFNNPDIKNAFKEATGQLYHGDGFYLSAIPREWDKEPW